MEFKHANDLILLNRWRAGRDAGAFRALVERYAGLVFAAAHRVLRDASAAEDVAQECFLTLAQTRKPPERNLGAWLHASAVNRAKNHIRGEVRRREREQHFDISQPGRFQTELNDSLAHVDEAIAALDEELRHVIVAHFLEGKSQGEIADSTGVSRQTVNARVKRGVEAIREHLAKKGVTATTASLTALLGTQMVEAAPAALVAALGKVALSGGVAAGSGVAKVGLVASLVLLVVGGLVVGDRVQSKGGTSLAPSGAPVPGVSSDLAVLAKDEIPRTVPSDIAVDVEPNAGLRGSLSGSLRDRKGEPITGATIEILGKDGTTYHADVDEHGRFQRDGVRSGRYVLSAKSANREISEGRNIQYSSATSELDVAAGEEKAGIDLVCDCEMATVAGRVMDGEGRPVPDLQLRLTSTPGMNARVRIGNLSVRTDGGGRFRFEAYGPDDYWIVSDEEGARYRLTEFPITTRPGETDLELLAFDQSSELLHVQVVDGRSGAPVERFGYHLAESACSGGSEMTVTEGLATIRVGDAASVHFCSSEIGGATYSVRPGDPGGGRIRIALSPEVHSNSDRTVGTLVDADGKPVPFAKIFPRNISQVELGKSIGESNEDGQFEIHDGEASTHEYYVKKGDGPALVPVVEDSGDLTLRLPDTGSIHGWVKVRSEGIPQVAVRLDRVILPTNMDAILLTAQSDEKGGFQFAGLPRGEYIISLETPILRGMPCIGDNQKTITVGPEPVSEIQFDFEASRTVGELAGTLREGQSGVEGTIELVYVSKQSFSDYFIERHESKFRAAADRDGKFAISSLFPGRTEVVATRGGSVQRIRRVMAELKPGKNQIDIPFAPATASLDCRIECGEEKVLFATYSLTINTTAGIEEVRRAHAPVAETGVSLDDLPAGPATLVIEFYFSRGSEEYEREVLLKSGALTVLELNEEG